MTDAYFFDTDCLSAFLWVNGESLLAKLYPNRVILPEPVYNEIKKVPHLLAQVDVMKNNNDLTVMPITVGSEEYTDYYNMTQSPENGEKVIGRGEAAGIALTKKYHGTLASNNLRDIAGYVAKYNLKHTSLLWKSSGKSVAGSFCVCGNMENPPDSTVESDPEAQFWHMEMALGKEEG